MTFFELISIPEVGISVLAFATLAMILHHWRQLALIRSGLIKKRAVRSWRVDFEKLRGGLWLMAVGGVLAAALHYDAVRGWTAFWLLVALLGVGQVLASLFGRDRWSYKGQFRRAFHKE